MIKYQSQKCVSMQHLYVFSFQHTCPRGLCFLVITHHVLKLAPYLVAPRC